MININIKTRSCLYIWTQNKVFVFAGNNLAYYKPTNQSSTDGKYGSSLTVDSNKDNSLDHGSCSRTQYRNSAVWSVELQGIYDVKVVFITSREDCCCMLQST